MAARRIGPIVRRSSGMPLVMNCSMLSKGADDAQGRVLRARRVAHAVDDQLEHALDRPHRRDAPDGGVERLELAMLIDSFALCPHGREGELQGLDKERNSHRVAPRGSDVRFRLRRAADIEHALVRRGVMTGVAAAQ